MKNFKLGLSFLIFLIFTACALSGCDGQSTPPEDPDGKDRPTISISARDFSVFFDGRVGEGIILGGKEYREGSLLPVFAELSDRLSIDFSESPDGGDVIFGDAAELSRAGVFGELLNLSEYIDDMPNFAAFLSENPDIRLSVSAKEDGSFYAVPYLAESDYINTPLFNAEAVRLLLDGAGPFVSESTATVEASSYKPYMPTEGTVTVKIMSGGKSCELTKNYDATGNVIDYMSYRLKKGPLSAVEAVNILRDYIDDAYAGFYGERRSELFLGESAAWDADELVALLRCSLALGDEYGSIFAFDSESAAPLAGMLFGVPGLLSYNYLYSGENGELCDARLDTESYDAVLRFVAMTSEGLVSDELCETRSEGLVSALPPICNACGEYTRLVGYSPKISGYAVALNSSLSENGDKLDAVLRFVDYLFSDEGAMLAGYGTETFYTADGGQVLPSETALSLAEEYTDGDLLRFKREYLGAALLFPYGKSGNGSAEEGSVTEEGIALHLIEAVGGTLTDDGEYLFPTPVRMYTEEEYALCDSSLYCNNYLDVFEEILGGKRSIETSADARGLIAVLACEASRSDYIELKRTEAERYLRCYKGIVK